MKTQDRDMLDKNIPGHISSEMLHLTVAFVKSVSSNFLSKKCFPVSFNYTKVCS